MTEEQLEALEARCQYYDDQGFSAPLKGAVLDLVVEVRRLKAQLERTSRCPECGKVRECVGCGDRW